MAKEINPILELNDFKGNIVFEKKEQENSENLSLQEQMIKYQNEVLGIQVISVALPPNFNPEMRNKSKGIDWHQKIVQNQNT